MGQTYNQDLSFSINLKKNIIYTSMDCLLNSAKLPRYVGWINLVEGIIKSIQLILEGHGTGKSQSLPRFFPHIALRRILLQRPDWLLPWSR